MWSQLVLSRFYTHFNIYVVWSQASSKIFYAGYKEKYDFICRKPCQWYMCITYFISIYERWNNRHLNVTYFVHTIIKNMKKQNQSHKFNQSYVLLRNKSFNQRKQSRGTKTNGELTKVEAFRTIKANDNGWSGALPSFTPFHPANYQHALSYRPLRSPCLDPEIFSRNFPQNARRFT